MTRDDCKEVFALIESISPSIPKFKIDAWKMHFWVEYKKDHYKKEDVIAALRYIRDAGEHRDTYKPPDKEHIGRTINFLKQRKHEKKIEEAPYEADPERVKAIIAEAKEKLDFECKFKSKKPEKVVHKSGMVYRDSSKAALCGWCCPDCKKLCWHNLPVVPRNHYMCMQCKRTFKEK